MARKDESFDSITDVDGPLEELTFIEACGFMYTDYLLQHTAAANRIDELADGAQIIAVRSAWVVNNAFATELLMKSLHMLDHGFWKKGHSLKSLYGSLRQDTRDRARKLFEAYLQMRP